MFDVLKYIEILSSKQALIIYVVSYLKEKITECVIRGQVYYAWNDRQDRQGSFIIVAV